MMDSRPETTLTTEKLHWGMIIPVVLFACGLLVLALPGVFIMRVAANLANQMSPQTARFTSWLPLWVLLPISLTLLLGLGISWVAYLTSEITLTEYRVIFRTGFFFRHSGELPLENLESIFITEPVLGRLLGYGTVTITSVGGQTFPFHYMRTPQRFYSMLQGAVTTAKALSKPVHKPPAAKPLPANDDSRYMPKG
jgi:uncharacterized membrane protein YdbT with pleckstrin-like domain